MKRGLGQTTLPTMKISLAGQESLAEQSLCALERATFHETLMMRDQHVLDVVRVVEKENILRAETEIDYIAVLARRALQVGKRIAAKGREISAEQFAFRAWWITQFCQP
jgi:hypothetical protein